MKDSITVFTVTRGRPEMLRRAVASVRNQDYAGTIQHVVLIDACPDTRDFLNSFTPRPANLIWHWLGRTEGERSGPVRLARLRNHAVGITGTRRVAFLDDDNEYEPNHLSSLVSCAEATGCPAVHSHRKLFRRDGSPYLEESFPWCRDPEEAKRLYEKMRRRGLFRPGSNVVTDRADPPGVEDPVRTVDMSEWLFETGLLRRYPFKEEYTYEDWLNIKPEDSKLTQSLVGDRVPIACTGMPTLRYYLGGYSNAFESGDASTIVWKWS